MEKSSSDLITEAEKYLQGVSLRQLSQIYHVSHVTIYDDLVNKLAKVDGKLHQEVIAALADRSPKSIKDKNVQKRVLTSYYMYVNEGNLIEEIANDLNVSYFTTYRDLEKRLVELHNFDSSLVTSEMIAKVKELMTLHANENLLEGNDAYLTEKRDSSGRFTR